MLIHDLERKTGLDRATIRYYEKEELLIRNERKMVTDPILKQIRIRC